MREGRGGEGRRGGREEGEVRDASEKMECNCRMQLVRWLLT